MIELDNPLAPKRQPFQPDNVMLVNLLSRLMTRNEPDRLKQSSDRMQFQMNVSNLTYHPQMHLGFCVKLIDQYADAGKLPTFEIGLMMGASIALCAASRDGEAILRKMLADISTQQDSGPHEEDMDSSTAGTDAHTQITQTPQGQQDQDCGVSRTIAQVLAHEASPIQEARPQSAGVRALEDKGEA
jgi:hypothetical protein